MGSLSQVVYLSSSTDLLGEPELQQLLIDARERNQDLEISGLLLYADGNFMQVLEGPRQNVETLMSDIENDPRHHGILVLLDQVIEHREFPDWSMALFNVSEKDAEGFSDFFRGDSSVHQQYILSGKAKKLLMSFRDHLNRSSV